ncbi:DUF3253 domain-containing protein [Microbacterium yannicii]|jgi:hypothetical protein|uniref:DUF3253 domain-containing protein n=1 Tax=Microbacterium yannicii TaxID=671622 RepID=UPI0002E4D843|nr:DUF3253 domain-containing protein [Microbacterium yannicii]
MTAAGAGEESADRRLEAAILDLLDRRAASSSICPSDAARAVAAEGDWRPLMEPARQAAQRLVQSGDVEITQGGDVVELSDVRGPIRIRRRRR